MLRAVATAVGVLALLSTAAQESHATCGPCKAEQVTAATANSRLFGGTDSAGGVGDWYLTNGVVEAIVDDIGTTPINVLPSGTVSADITSSNAVETGGTLIDLGRKGKQNDQFPQGFNTGGLSLDNVFIFRDGDETAWGVPAGNNPCATIGTANANCPLDVTDTDCAAVNVYGIMLGSCKTPTDFCSTRTSPKMRVHTTYKACKGSRALQIRTEVWNQSGSAQLLPIFDVFLWGGRGLTPFAPDSGRGFTQPALDISSAAAIVASLTQAPYVAIPGNVDKNDGNMARGKKANAISYGYYSEGGQTDSNGGAPGGTISSISGPFIMQSIQSPLLSAATLNTLIGPTLPIGQSRIFNRRIVVGDRNDVASVVGDLRNPESILPQTGASSVLGTVSGKVTPASSEEGTITFIRTGGTMAVPSLAPFGLGTLNTAPVSQVRTKSTFSRIQLPEGVYVAQVVFPGRDDIYSAPFTVNTALNTAIPPIALPKTGKLKIEVRDADLGTGIPAKVSISPSPVMARDFPSFAFNTKTGMCSNDFTTACSTNGDCGGGNTCFRTCTNKEPTSCNPGSCAMGEICASDNKCRSLSCTSDAACDPGYLCRADTSNSLPESYPGTQKLGGQS
ncbi:MAG TPA: hypothetical protein VMT89_05130, partial [Candidatus Acidoferrales bacterium]|nr:hypothetical protein [Candidatus Acidoferrales bacterium]